MQNSGFYLVLVFGLFALSPMHAQSEVQETTAISFHNEKLSEILMKLSDVSNINFSYDANDPVFNTRVTYASDGKNLQKVLEDILTNTGLTHKQIGNQIVLFQTDESILHAEEIANREEVAPVSAVQGTNNEFSALTPEMNYQLDTVFLKDTIYRIDTIRVVDTVFIEQEKPEKPAPSKIKEIPVDYFQYGMEREKGWALDIFVAPLLSDFSVVKDQQSFSLRSFSLGMDAIKLLNRWNLSLGLRLTQFDQRFTQQYSVDEGGFFNKDTIDAYYTVINTDTSWFYVTDSSWVPLETREYSYDKINTLGYLEFNVSASFDFYKSEKMRLYLRAGGQISFLIYNNGIAIPGDNQVEATSFEDMQFNKVNYAYLVGTGMKYKLADKIDLNTELYYTGYLNQLIPDYPIDTHINAIGLKLGLIFYF